MSRDWSTAREFGRTLQAGHLLQQANSADLSGDDILTVLNVNEIIADAQPKKVTISGLGAAAAPFVASASGSAVGINGAIQYNNNGFVAGSPNLVFDGSGVYSSGVSSPNYTTNLAGFVSVATSGYTLLNTDNGRTVLFTNQSPTVVTIPAGLDPGFNCTLIQTTISGQVRLASGVAVSLNSAYGALKTTTRYSVAGVIGISNNSYIVTGDITV